MDCFIRTKNTHRSYCVECLLPLTLSDGPDRQRARVVRSEQCSILSKHHEAAKITFTTESSQPTRVSRILGVDEIHVARSLEDLEHRIYEFGELRTWDLLPLPGQRLNPDFYSLQKGSSFFIERDIDVFIGTDKAGQSRLAPIPSHRVVLVLRMPPSYRADKTASAPQTIYGIRTQPAELSSGAIERLSEGCGGVGDSLK